MFAWFSEKGCLLIARSEGSLSGALKSDLLPVGVVVVGAAAAVVGAPAGGAAADADAVVVDGGVADVDVGIGVCAAWPLLLLWTFLISLSLSSGMSSSLVSCWYISSTMGFHNRTLAFMNQFDT